MLQDRKDLEHWKQKFSLGEYSSGCGLGDSRSSDQQRNQKKKKKKKKSPKPKNKQKSPKQKKKRKRKEKMEKFYDDSAGDSLTRTQKKKRRLQERKKKLKENPGDGLRSDGVPHPSDIGWPVPESPEEIREILRGITETNQPCLPITMKDSETNPEWAKLATTSFDDPYFEERLKELIIYRQQHGHCLVPISSSPDGPHLNLGVWVAWQRLHKRYFEEGNPVSSLNPPRIAALEKLDFDWDPYGQFAAASAWQEVTQPSNAVYDSMEESNDGTGYDSMGESDDGVGYDSMGESNEESLCAKVFSGEENLANAEESGDGSDFAKGSFSDAGKISRAEESSAQKTESVEEANNFAKGPFPDAGKNTRSEESSAQKTKTVEEANNFAKGSFSDAGKNTRSKESSIQKTESVEEAKWLLDTMFLLEGVQGGGLGGLFGNRGESTGGCDKLDDVMTGKKTGDDEVFSNNAGRLQEDLSDPHDESNYKSDSANLFSDGGGPSDADYDKNASETKDSNNEQRDADTDLNGTAHSDESFVIDLTNKTGDDHVLSNIARESPENFSNPPDEANDESESAKVLSVAGGSSDDEYSENASENMDSNNEQRDVDTDLNETAHSDESFDDGVTTDKTGNDEVLSNIAGESQENISDPPDGANGESESAKWLAAAGGSSDDDYENASENMDSNNEERDADTDLKETPHSYESLDDNVTADRTGTVEVLSNVAGESQESFSDAPDEANDESESAGVLSDDDDVNASDVEDSNDQSDADKKKETAEEDKPEESKIDESKPEEFDAKPNSYRKRHAPKSKWDVFFDKLKNFMKKHGIYETGGFVDATWCKKGFSNWVIKQRENYELKMLGMDSDITDEQIEKLESIGFHWRREEDEQNSYESTDHGREGGSISGAPGQGDESSSDADDDSDEDDSDSTIDEGSSSSDETSDQIQPARSSKKKSTRKQARKSTQSETSEGSESDEDESESEMEQDSSSEEEDDDDSEQGEETESEAFSSGEEDDNNEEPDCSTERALVGTRKRKLNGANYTKNASAHETLTKRELLRLYMHQLDQVKLLKKEKVALQSKLKESAGKKQANNTKLLKSKDKQNQQLKIKIKDLQHENQKLMDENFSLSQCNDNLRRSHKIAMLEERAHIKRETKRRILAEDHLEKAKQLIPIELDSAMFR